MGPSDLKTAIKSVPVFAALDDGAVGELAGACVVRAVLAGEALVSAGEAAEQFYLILAGQVKVFRLSPKGDEQILHLYGPGKTFGEAAVWAGGKFPATAEAVSDGQLLVIRRDVVTRLIKANPETALGMLAGLSGKLQEFAALIDDLSLKEVPARLAGVLLAESKRAGAFTFELTQTKRHLAAQIGTVAETLSRALKKLEDTGLIEVTGKQIALLDMAGLRELYEGA
ncbi:MAG: Crp/Fnr family transcriptional regulator [Planctomycetota bacterium]|jgi:CRP/FNR family transcriptional regulator